MTLSHQLEDDLEAEDRITEERERIKEERKRVATAKRTLLDVCVTPRHAKTGN